MYIDKGVIGGKGAWLWGEKALVGGGSMARLLAPPIQGHTREIMVERQSSAPETNLLGSTMKCASIRYTPHTAKPMPCRDVGEKI